MVCLWGLVQGIRTGPMISDRIRSDSKSESSDMCYLICVKISMYEFWYTLDESNQALDRPWSNIHRISFDSLVQSGLGCVSDRETHREGMINLLCKRWEPAKSKLIRRAHLLQKGRIRKGANGNGRKQVLFGEERHVNFSKICHPQSECNFYYSKGSSLHCRSLPFF